MQNPWRIEVNEVKEEYVDTFKFFFEQAEKKLRWSLEVGDRITTRCYLIVAVILPLMTLLVSVLGRFYVLEESELKKVVGLCWVGMSMTFSVLVTLMSVLFPRSSHQIGREPKKIALKIYFDNEQLNIVNKKALALVLKNEIEEYQKRIDESENQNASRVKRFKLALILICVGFGLSLGVILYHCVVSAWDILP